MTELQALLAADWLPWAALLIGVAMFAADNGGGLWTAAKAKAAKAWKSLRSKRKGSKGLTLSPAVILAMVVAAASYLYQREWAPVVQPNPPPVVEPTVTDPATAAAYIYEQRQSAIPSAVLAGLDKLNRAGKVRATTFDKDTIDGDGNVPDQYKTALPAAVAAGLPALVVLSGDKVLKVVPNPTTEEQIVGAVQ